MMNEIIWYKPNATPNALHTAFTHAHETLIRAFVGAELEEGFAELVARRISAMRRGSLLREISEQFWTAP